MTTPSPPLEALRLTLAEVEGHPEFLGHDVPLEEINRASGAAIFVTVIGQRLRAALDAHPAESAEDAAQPAQNDSGYERAALHLESAANRLHPAGKKRTAEVDRHTAEVLRRRAAEIGAMASSESAEAGAVPADSGRLKVAVDLLRDCLVPLEVAAAIKDWAPDEVLVGAVRNFVDGYDKITSSPAAPAPAGMAGLTHAEVVDACTGPTSTSRWADDVIRAFCAKNGLALAEKREGAKP